MSNLLQERPSPVGITATIPVEILFAAGRRPVDLNNLFITSEDPGRLMDRAERDGFSRSLCAWIRGIYGAVLEFGIQEVIAVTGGDCSNTVALAELLARRGVRVTPFHYPLDRSREALVGQMEHLRQVFSTTWKEILEAKERLDRIRRKLRVLDALTYEGGRVTGLENHAFLVASSDFNGDPDLFEGDLDAFLLETRVRRPSAPPIRLGYLGVPPIFDHFYETVEALGARVVYNEVQRQFSMPVEAEDILDQYLLYTYPYAIEGRIGDILDAVASRGIHGLIHYSQTFCYRQIYEVILKEVSPVPLLTLEGDRPGAVDGRTVVRIETFIEMLRSRHLGGV